MSLEWYLIVLNFSLLIDLHFLLFWDTNSFWVEIGIANMERKKAGINSVELEDFRCELMVFGIYRQMS